MNRKVVRTYLLQSTLIIAVLTLLSFVVWWVAWPNNSMPMAIAISAAFQLLTCYAYGYVWGQVADSSADSLPTLYLAASGCRMFLGIATVVVYCLINTDDTVGIRTFVILFLVYYFIMLIYDTAYFMKVEKKIRQNV